MSAAVAHEHRAERAPMSALETIELCTARLIAAAAAPSWARIGAAIERRPYASSSLLIA